MSKLGVNIVNDVSRLLLNTEVMSLYLRTLTSPPRPRWIFSRLLKLFSALTLKNVRPKLPRVRNKKSRITDSTCYVLGVPSSNMMATIETLKNDIKRKKMSICFAFFISGSIFLNSDFKSYRTAAKFISSFFLATIGL